MRGAPEVVEPLGKVFTRRWVVDWMLDLAGYDPAEPLFARSVVEPSCGDGAFVLPMVQRLVTSCERHDVPIGRASDALTAVDLHASSVTTTREQVVGLLTTSGVSPEQAADLASNWVRQADFLLAENLPAADLVIGNPPYVRLEDIPAGLMAAYRQRWITMTGRADLYVAFHERGLDLLRREGRLIYICADRWMRNAYGKALRTLIHQGEFAVDTVIRLHDADCFDTEVSAYPAITVIRKGEQRDGVVIEATPEFQPHHVGEVDLAAAEQTSAKTWTTARVPGWFGPAMWPEGPASDLRRLAAYEQRFEPLEDVLRQTRVGIGVATGADSIFVTSDANLVEPDRMLPLVMAGHISDGQLRWTERYLVNPWNGHGLVDLNAYPKMAAYMHRHADKLGGRHVARRQPVQWYKTIDRVHPWLTDTPKILLADMKNRMTPVVDDGHYYPHHNLYWITSTTWDPYVLAGLLLADHAELFVRSYCVKMRGGTLRMQAQYLRRICVPHPDDLTGDQQEQFRQAYLTRDRDLATHIATQIYD